MLSLVQPPDLCDERQLLRFVESTRLNWAATAEALLPLLLAVIMLSVSCNWAAGLALGVAISLALSRYGPHRWPGRRRDDESQTSPPTTGNLSALMQVVRDQGVHTQRLDDTDDALDVMDRAIKRDRADIDDILDYLDDRDPGWRR
jgi:hypothetical protein